MRSRSGGWIVGWLVIVFKRVMRFGVGCHVVCHCYHIVTPI
jgi:hypothetical protein